MYERFVDPDSPDYLHNVEDEFTGNWICPNVTSFELYGDPLFMPFQRGKSFFMIVNSCSVAKQYDQEMLD